MKRLWAILLALTLLLTMTACSGSDSKNSKGNPQVGVTLIEGSAGVSENEEAKFAFDFDLRTKWCMNFTGDAYAIWKLDEPVRPTGYTYVTATDSERFKSRNPLTWTVYAMKSEEPPSRYDEGWVAIDVRENDYSFPNQNTDKVYLPIESVVGKFNYFKLEVSAVHYGDVMQIGEFVIEYPGSDYSYSGGVFKSDKIHLGSSYITDNITFDVRVGDSIVLYHPGIPTTILYAYYWDLIEEESEGEIVLASSGDLTCEVIGLKEGKVAIEGTLNYNTSVGYHVGETVIQTIKVYINVISKDAEKPEIGNVHNGGCPICRGTKSNTCMACYGDGKLDGGKSCSGCSKGKVPCYFCGGTGTWEV